MGLILWIATNNPQNYLYAGSQASLLMSRFLVILLGLLKKNPREHKSFLTYAYPETDMFDLFFQPGLVKKNPREHKSFLTYAYPEIDMFDLFFQPKQYFSLTTIQPVSAKF